MTCHDVIRRNAGTRIAPGRLNSAAPKITHADPATTDQNIDRGIKRRRAEPSAGQPQRRAEEERRERPRADAEAPGRDGVGIGRVRAPRIDAEDQQHHAAGRPRECAGEDVRAWPEEIQQEQRAGRHEHHVTDHAPDLQRDHRCRTHQRPFSALQAFGRCRRGFRLRRECSMSERPKATARVSAASSARSFERRQGLVRPEYAKPPRDGN